MLIDIQLCEHVLCSQLHSFYHVDMSIITKFSSCWQKALLCICCRHIGNTYSLETKNRLKKFAYFYVLHGNFFLIFVVLSIVNLSHIKIYFQFNTVNYLTKKMKFKYVWLIHKIVNLCTIGPKRIWPMWFVILIWSVM